MNSIPEGWQLVPIVPTEKMHKASGNPRKPEAVCAAGAALLGMAGTADHRGKVDSRVVEADLAFRDAYGVLMEEANDNYGFGREGLPIDVIAGMLDANRPLMRFHGKRND